MSEKIGRPPPSFEEGASPSWRVAPEPPDEEEEPSGESASLSGTWYRPKRVVEVSSAAPGGPPAPFCGGYPVTRFAAVTFSIALLAWAATGLVLAMSSFAEERECSSIKSAWRAARGAG